jgi:hypothetical protein
MRKKQNFESPVIDNPSYAGEAASDFIAAALLSAKTLENNYVTLHPNVKYREVIQKLNVDDIVADASCDFIASPSGSVSITERELTPKELQVNLDLCKKTFVNSWEALSLGYSAFDEIPRNFTDYLVSYVGGKVAEKTETDIWQGSSAVNGQFQGFEGALTAATDVVKTVTSGSVDSSTVIAALNEVYLAIPDTVYGKEDLVIYAGTQVVKAYQQALSGQTNVGSFNNQLNVGEKPSNFQGIEIVLCPGMSAGTIIAAQKSNLHFGTGLMSDFNEVRVLDMAQLDGSQNFRIIMRYTADTEFGVGQDIVYRKGA